MSAELESFVYIPQLGLGKVLQLLIGDKHHMPTDVKANPAIADLAGSSSKPLRYENLSTFERLSFECIALSKESQNSCHSSSFPLNFRTSSLGSFTLAGFTELEVAPFSTTFWFKGLGGDPLMF